MQSEKLLEVKDLKTYFFIQDDVYKAVDGVSFAINPGEILAIVGESGSGKSVTASSILQIVPNPPGKIVGGEIIFSGENLLDKTQDEMRNLRGGDIAMIFQEPMTSLNPVFRIGEQIKEAIFLHHDFLDEQGNKIPRSKHKKVAEELAAKVLDAVGIPDAHKQLRNYPHQLSGGMRQRVMIAMALVSRPHLLIADEPTSALDVTVQAQILDLLLHLQEQYGTAIILITHDFGVVAEVANDVAVMYAGQVLEVSAVDEIFARPLHPYTYGLLQSIPRLDKDEEELYVIKGTVPNSAYFPQGCRFAPRCEKCEQICIDEMPELRELGANHFVRCHLAEEVSR